MSPEDAHEQASQDMHHILKRDLMNEYKRLLILCYKLKPTIYHQRVMKNIKKYLDKGYTIEQAAKLSIRLHSNIFDEIINEHEYPSQEESDE